MQKEEFNILHHGRKNTNEEFRGNQEELMRFLDSMARIDKKSWHHKLGIEEVWRPTLDIKKTWHPTLNQEEVYIPR